MLRLQISSLSPRRFIGLSLFVTLVLGLITTSGAATAQSSDANAAQGLQISPASVELNAEKGKTYTLKIKILNVTGSDLVYASSSHDFGAQNETGSPRILTDGSLPASASVRSWISSINQFTLRGHESRDLNVTVTIPSNAEPGGHYGILSLSGRAPEMNNPGVGLTASTGLLILIRVDGPINEKVSLASFATEKNGQHQSFFETSPINFVTRLKNEGNVHVKPAGTITIHDMFGGLVASLPVNEKLGNVLPGSIRRFEAELSKDWMIGRYSADLTLGYGTTGQAITNTIGFWVIPYKLILGGLLVLSTVVFIFSRMIKVYNRRIIAKSKHENTTKNKKHNNKKN